MKRINKLRSSGVANRFAGIIECIDNKNVSDDELLEIKKLKNDSVIIAGRQLSSYAYAALDILNIEKYQGKDLDVKSLISEMK